MGLPSPSTSGSLLLFAGAAALVAWGSSFCTWDEVGTQIVGQEHMSKMIRGVRREVGALVQ